ncbi:MAG: type II toxin-antitoxin system RelE/ParE family toxin [Gammaproteobacteria bacterium]
MKIFISSSAFSDLEISKNITRTKVFPIIGEQFVVSIIDHIQTLSNNSDIGRKVPEFDEDKIRELIHPPFRIVYLREKNSIHIIRVWRSERLLELPEQEI